MRTGNPGDEIHIVNFNPNDPYNGPHGIDFFQFVDGTVLTYAQLIDRGFDLTGTDGNDTITGTATVDRIAGGGGNDTLTGGAGDDVLDGGIGNDMYQFGLGDGHDILTDASGADTVSFAAGIATGDLHADRSGNDLILSFSANDQTTFSGWFTGNVVEQFLFSDGSVLSSADIEALTVHGQNSSPQLTTPMTDQATNEDAPLSFQVPANTFTDPDAGDTLTYTATLADGTALPVWLTFDAATRTFSGTPANGDVGSLGVRVSAMDSHGLSVSDTFALTVANTNDAPVLVTALADQSVDEDSVFSFTLPPNTFADDDLIHGDSLTFSATLADGSALPAWLSFDAATRTFSGTPANADVGTFDVSVSATDSVGASVTDTFALTVANVNDAPVLANALADQNGTRFTAFTYQVPLDTFTDEDAIHGDTLTYNAILADGSALPAWLAFDATTRIFSGTPGAGDAGSVDVMVTATDTGGLSAADVFTLMVNPGTIYGSEADDHLIGTAFDDEIYGLGGNDVLEGLAGNDRLDGGTGADILNGGAGDDTYVVDDANDVVVELTNEGTDTVFAGISAVLADNIENLNLTGVGDLDGTGNARDNTLTGNDGINILSGLEGADTLLGLGGDDTLYGGAGDDVLLGGDGADFLEGGNGNDILDGGTGVNKLWDGGGNDTYIIYAGTDFSSVLDDDTTPGNIDTIRFVDVLPQDVTAVVNRGTLEMTINRSDGTQGWLDIDSWDFEGGLIERIEFADGTVWDPDYILSMTSAATEGNDFLYGDGRGNVMQGLGGDDLFYGMDGDDTLYGGSGNDFVVGDNGNDILYGDSGDDTLDGVMGDDMLHGGSGNDDLYGYDGNDILYGDSGNDVLRGEAGNDTYFIGRGDGQDTINQIFSAVDDVDVLRFGNDVARADVDIRLYNGDLVFTLKDTGEAIRVQDWSLSADNRIDEARFGDGTRLTTADLTATDYRGTTGKDRLTGSAGADRLYGDLGNDTLIGNAGNDTLDGGAGNDALQGGAGNDTYLFTSGWGTDTITENDTTAGNTDTVSFGSGINPLNLVFSKSGSDLMVSRHGSTDSIDSTSWYSGTAYQTELFRAADGSTLVNAQVDQLIQAMAQFSASHGGITWDQAIDQNPNEVQAVLAAYWQPSGG